ncbi:MAG: hypothetical protein JOZ72_14930 [Alphaproteobacteria bacterium]|nr:hypothetical protein [Alphaproteobacteria bacterium]
MAQTFGAQSSQSSCAQSSRAQSSRERLNHLLDLAAQGPEGRTALLGELAGLLVDWPADYAQAMRAPFEALFEKTARETDRFGRAAVAPTLSGHDELPVALLNEFFLDAPASLRAEILKRNDALDADATEPAPARADGEALVGAARRTVNGAFAEVFARALSLRRPLAQAILDDASGEALAVACKGAGLDRAAYSAVALMAGCPPSQLAGYDAIPDAAAGRLTRFWQERG